MERTKRGIDCAPNRYSSSAVFCLPAHDMQWESNGSQSHRSPPITFGSQPCLECHISSDPSGSVRPAKAGSDSVGVGSFTSPTSRNIGSESFVAIDASASNRDVLKLEISSIYARKALDWMSISCKKRQIASFSISQKGKCTQLGPWLSLF